VLSAGRIDTTPVRAYVIHHEMPERHHQHSISNRNRMGVLTNEPIELKARLGNVYSEDAVLTVLLSASCWVLTRPFGTNYTIVALQATRLRDASGANLSPADTFRGWIWRSRCGWSIQRLDLFSVFRVQRVSRRGTPGLMEGFRKMARMPTKQERRSHFRGTRLILLAVGAVTVMGCQSASRWRHPQGLARPSSLPSQMSVAQSDHDDVLSPSASDAMLSATEVDGANDLFAEELGPIIISESEAKDLISRLRGKLRASDDGVIVETDLSFSDVSDDQLASLEAFPEIRELDLTGTQIHDRGLAVLPKLRKLQALKLKGTRISSEGMQSLAEMTSLVLLDASNTNVSDDGLAVASHWTSLRYLSLNNTTVSDAAIPYLKSVDTLKGLSLLNTNLTTDGVRTLKESLPDCLIVTNTEIDLRPAASAVPLFPVLSPADAEFPKTSDTQLQQLVQMARQQPQIAIHLASIYSTREQWFEAVQILSAAAAVDSHDKSLQLALGAALARSGNSLEAKTYLTQAVGEAAANYNLGLIEYENNLRSCANRFRIAIAADPSLTDAETRLADVQRELADLQRQRMPLEHGTSEKVVSQDEPFEVIPAPHMRPVSNSRVR